MPWRVFGTPIDEKYMRKLPKYWCRGTCFKTEDIVERACKLENKDGEACKCKTFLEKCKQADRYGKNVSCMIYNATDGDLKFVLAYDWSGRLLGIDYPKEIKNGQWAGWFHVTGDTAVVGSTAAVVYRGKNIQGKPMDWLHSWSLPAQCCCNKKVRLNLQVHVEARDAGHYSKVNWSCIRRSLTPTKSKEECDGCTSEANISNDYVALYEGIMGVTT